MYVKTTRRRRGDKCYEYLSIVESARVDGKVRHRTLMRLGERDALVSSGQLPRIVAALEAHLERDVLDVAGIEVGDAAAVGGAAAVEAVWRRLGLDGWFAEVGAGRGAGAFGDAVFAMVANRLVDPMSKRRLPEWVAGDVAMPSWFTPPSPNQYYRSLDLLAETKPETEQQLYSALCDLTNLDLRLVCYDLTSSYMEGSTAASDVFPSKAFGYSRDKRSDRPQIVLGMLTTGDGIPIAHHVFAGNTADASTLPEVLADLQARFGVGRICLVADRGLINAENLDIVSEHGYDHILATRLHRDGDCAHALAESSHPTACWIPVPESSAAACETVSPDGRRHVVVARYGRYRRDHHRRDELVARTAASLSDLELRVRRGRLKDAGKIGRAAQRIVGSSGVARLFDLEIDTGRFLYHYNEQAFDYEDRLAGKYVLSTSLTPREASTGRIVTSYRQLANIERRFRTLKDFLRLRPIRHWTEQRVRGHIAVCVYAAIVEAVIARDLAAADIADPDIGTQHLTAPRALRELDRIRRVDIDAGDGRRIRAITRRTPLQTRILAAVDADTAAWNKPEIA